MIGGGVQETGAVIEIGPAGDFSILLVQVEIQRVIGIESEEGLFDFLFHFDCFLFVLEVVWEGEEDCAFGSF